MLREEVFFHERENLLKFEHEAPFPHKLSTRSVGEGSLAIVSLPSDISAPAWADVTKPETAPALVELELHTLSAAARYSCRVTFTIKNINVVSHPAHGSSVISQIQYLLAASVW